MEYPFITLGRLSENKVVLTDYHISGEHAQIFWEENQYIYHDLRSTNGSIIEREGKQIHLDGSERWEMPIRVGDKLLLGAPYSPVILLCRELAAPSNVSESERSTKVVFTRTIDQIDDLRGKVANDTNLAAIMYHMVQTIGRGGLELNQVLKSVSEAVFNLIERSTNVSIFLKSEPSSRFRMVYACNRKNQDNIGGSKSLIQLVLKRKAAVIVADAPEE
ncbi:FHA domain-containing protein, partial [Myxococcota bacterium]|nr:FHA domain-containing protein [Myxococcota bacterium]